MTTWMISDHTAETQKRAIFTGEGAYHGSTKPRTDAPAPQTDVVSEARPTTLERYIETGVTDIQPFEATFPNWYEEKARLSVPTQEQVRTDQTTFCWCEFEKALQVAGPLTRSVLEAMAPHLFRQKQFAYVDSKIQYFEPGDTAVDNMLWHVDGSIAVRDTRVQRYGATTLHDMRARFEHQSPPRYLAYQSSDHCATLFVPNALRLRMPELMPNFNQLHEDVEAQRPYQISHPPGAIVAFNGLTLHRAIQASAPGWRLWIRVTETDVKIVPNADVIGCYGTVFQPRR